jgi:hypothetical protein
MRTAYLAEPKVRLQGEVVDSGVWFNTPDLLRE